MRKQTEQKRARLNLSLNLSAPNQREAWRRLCAIPTGQRTDAVCRAVCRMYEQDALLEAVRQIVREELRSVEFTSAKEKTEQPQAGDVDDNVLGFLLALDVDFIDYYLLHNLQTVYYDGVDGTGGVIKTCHLFDHALKWKEDGKIRHLGISFHSSADLLDRILTERIAGNGF